MVEMSVNLVCLKSLVNSLISTKITCECFKRTLRTTKISSSMSIHTVILKYIRPPKNEVSTWRATFISYSSRIAISRFYDSISRPLSSRSITRMNELMFANSNRNQLKTLMNSAMEKKQHLNQKQKNEKRSNVNKKKR